LDWNWVGRRVVARRPVRRPRGSKASPEIGGCTATAGGLIKERTILFIL
jgi:hypothetical protein